MRARALIPFRHRRVSFLVVSLVSIASKKYKKKKKKKKHADESIPRAMFLSD